MKVTFKNISNHNRFQWVVNEFKHGLANPKISVLVVISLRFGSGSTLKGGVLIFKSPVVLRKPPLLLPYFFKGGAFLSLRSPPETVFFLTFWKQNPLEMHCFSSKNWRKIFKSTKISRLPAIRCSIKVWFDYRMH